MAWNEILRWIHILSGSIVLILGLAQMILAKKGPVHRSIGKTYFILMIVIFLTSFPLSIQSQNWFLASVGLFSLHLVLSGYRFANNKKNDRNFIWDKLICYLGLFSALCLIGLTVYFFMNGEIGFAIVPGIFGLILFLNSISDFKFIFLNSELGKHGKMRWFFNHLSRMIASYIAAMTAFLVNVQPFGSNIINWIFPTIAGTIFIIAISKFYEKKFNLIKGKVN